MKNIEKQNRHRKIMLISAIIMTILLVLSMVALAWFSLQANLKSVAKVKNPSKIQILAGNTEGVENINIGDISLEDMNNDSEKIAHKGDDGKTVGYSKQYVFSVCSANDSYGLTDDYLYYIQLGHTTNIGFKYKLYRVEGDAVAVTGNYTAEQESSILNGSVAAYESDDGVTKYLYTKGEEIKLSEISVDKSETYGNFNSVQKNAVPVYLKTGGCEPDRFDEDDEEYEKWYFTDYYILEVYWDSGLSEKVTSKETDMVYIVVYDD
jgi:hypothetical protein